MQFAVSERERLLAKNPHELFILNLIVFHLLLAPAALALDIGAWALALPLPPSLAVMAFLYLRARRAERSDPWFVMAHWKAAVGRCRLLLIGYGMSGLVLLLAWLAASGMEGSMREIMFTVLTRIGVMPTVILVFVCFVLESSALYQAAHGEVAGGVVRRWSPPEGMTAI